MFGGNGGKELSMPLAERDVLAKATFSQMPLFDYDQNGRIDGYELSAFFFWSESEALDFFGLPPLDEVEADMARAERRPMEPRKR